MSAMEKISILFLSSEPTNTARLRLGEEFREIQEKLQLSKEREIFDLNVKFSVRPEDITQALLDCQPQIVHFSGHGTSRGELCFENQTGENLPVSTEALEALFSQFTNQISLVLLNACYSELQARAIAKHINCVIGMNKSIGDEAAIAFSIGFYQALGAGKSIEEAFEFGRIQINLNNIPEYQTPVLISSAKINHAGFQGNSYKVELGNRVRNLRENYLKISKRAMADFLGIETVTELDEYETGKKEFPKTYLNKVRDFFFVNRSFLESGEKPIFQSFYVFDKQLIDKLFLDGFVPVFLCKPRPRDGLYTFPMFIKEENDLPRSISTNLSSFHEDGRGKFNILQIIEQMHEHGIGEQKATCREVSPTNWESLESSSFYPHELYKIGRIDFECQDVFHTWYQERIAKQKQQISQLSILWVDDHPEGNRFLINCLEDSGFEVVTAKSTPEALILLNDRKFDRIISDMGRKEFWDHNPEAGLDLARKVRERDKYVPFLIYTTANAVQKYGDEAAKMGVTAIICSDSALLQILGVSQISK